jgi:hypothetical protein
MALERKELTKEQKKKLFKLHLNSLIRLCLWGAGHGVLLGVMNIAVILFAKYMEIPDDFIQVAGIVNIVFALFSLHRVNRAEHDRLNAEILKISENQNQ